MSVTVRIPRQLRRYVQNASEINVEADTLKATLDAVSEDYDLDGILLTPDGDLQDFVRVIIEERFVTSTGAEDLRRVPVSGKTIEITTAFAGG